MLEQRGIEFRYRDYRTDPLNESEIRSVLRKLGVRPGEVLRRRDKAFRALDLTGDEPDDVLIARMAENPTLLERPIAVMGRNAVVGRPPDDILSLVE